MSPIKTAKLSAMSNPAHRDFRPNSNSISRNYTMALATLVQGLSRGNLRVVSARPSGSQSSSTFKPRMDIWDDPASSNIIATFELPGVSQNELSVVIREGNLVVHGERRPRFTHPNAPHPSLRLQQESNTQGRSSASDEMQIESTSARRFPVQELRYGRFERMIPLPAGADNSCITASLIEGMLTVTWPRSPLPASTAQASPQANSPPSDSPSEGGSDGNTPSLLFKVDSKPLKRSETTLA